MDKIKIERTWLQGSPVQVDNLMGNAFVGEAGAHEFLISGKDNAGNVVPITGTITGKFLSSTMTTFALSGYVTEGVASVTLPSECYGAPGQFVVSIFATNGSTTTCIYCGVGSIFRTSTAAIAYPTTTLPDLTLLINQLDDVIASFPADLSHLLGAIAPTFVDNQPFTAGQYVWYNQVLYRFTADHPVGSWAGSADTVVAVVGTELNSTVRYTQQVLTDAQKTVARTNIDAADADDVTDLELTAVQVTPQTFDDNSKSQARSNIGAASSGDLSTLSGLVSQQGGYISDLTAAVGTVPAGETVEGQITDLKSAINDVEDAVDTYLVHSNVLYKQTSFTVGAAGQTYQRKTFYTLEKTFSSGEKYTFTCDSIVGNTALPMRYELFSGTTKIRDGGQSQVLYLQIEDSDISAGIDKVVFFVYASTGTAQTEACVLTNPVVYEGYSTEEVFSYSENFDNEVERLINQSQPELETIQTLSLGTLEDGFINSSTGVQMAATSHKRTTYIHLKADKIKVAITFGVDNVGFAFYDSRKKYISGFDHTGYNIGDIKEVDVPENAYYFRYCAINAQTSNMLVLIPNYANAISRIDTNPCFYDVSSECRTFKKILCIGDSLTAGQFDYKENGTIKEFNDPAYSYPTFLKALTGRDITNAGDAGETTVSWYELHGQEDFSGHDACIIMLGRNDYVSGRETTSEQRATAFENIIAKVRLDNPQIPIFMATLINYYKGDAAEAMNEDIRTAATANNCYLLDIATYGRMVLSDDAYSHCTAEGYYTLAEYFFRYISYIMHNNYTTFKTIQFVGTNRAY